MNYALCIMHYELTLGIVLSLLLLCHMQLHAMGIYDSNEGIVRNFCSIEGDCHSLKYC